jgi:hypothetical protein
MEDSSEGTKTLIKIQLFLDVRGKVSLCPTILRDQIRLIWIHMSISVSSSMSYFKDSPFFVINTHYNKHYKDIVRDLLLI